MGGVYGVGYNYVGQQGAGSSEESIPTFALRLENETIAEVVRGGYSGLTTWVLTTDGKLYGCGDNSYGQQGGPSDSGKTYVSTFTQRLADETIIKVAASGYTTWAITTEGKLYGCGYGYNGQQGNGSTANVSTFTQRLADKTIKDVVCSRTTTWVLTTDGKLYGCGHGSYGQQGDSSAASSITTFTQRLADKTIKDVVCEDNATWVITTDGDLYGCGRSNYGQQGNGSTNTVVTTFTLRLNGVKKVACSTETTWAVTDSKQLLGCGRGNSGQQGRSSTGNVTAFTERMTGIDDVVCSTSTTWAIDSNGKIYGCGLGSNGQQGNGSTSKVTAFTQRLADETIIKLDCAPGTTWALTATGKLYGCGDNYYGQQGAGTTGTNVTTFTQRLSDLTITDMWCSNATTWAITSAGPTPPGPSGGAEVNIKVNGAWTKGAVHVKANGAWVEAKKIYIKANGTWTESN